MRICSKQECVRVLWDSESGAVTVDWVVLSAAVIGLGAFSVVQIGQGSTNLANSIQGSLRFVLYPDPEEDGPRYSIQRLSDAQLEQWTTTYADQTDAQLLASVQLRHNQFMSHLEAQQWSQALQRVDYFHIIEQELATRSLQRPDDMPGAQALFDMYNDARS